MLSALDKNTLKGNSALITLATGSQVGGVLDIGQVLEIAFKDFPTSAQLKSQFRPSRSVEQKVLNETFLSQLFIDFS